MSQLLQDYDYQYPEELIAQLPLADRSASRLMLVDAQSAEIRHDRFRSLPTILQAGDLLVVNDTSVIASRLFARKQTGGKVEVFLLRKLAGLEWRVLLSPTRGLKLGDHLLLENRYSHAGPELSVRVTSLKQEDFRVEFDTALAEARALAKFGETPLPPYIRRSHPESEDKQRYQTVFAQHQGAVAAPTAGLHFDQKTRELLEQQGVELATITLHVGLGTFSPVREASIAQHKMHEEWYDVPVATQAAVQACRERGNKVVAVGTTSLRALESFVQGGRASGWTDLYILPGYQFKLVDALLTNFHQPKSSLLILVSALAGSALIRQAYAQAIEARYRLFSYGDCMLILP